MLINVAQLLKSGVGTQRHYELDEVLSEGASEAQWSLRGQVDLLRTDRGVLLRANLASEVKGRCDRCLVPLSQPLAIAMEEEFYPTVDIVHGGSAPPPESPDAFRIDEHHQLDLDEATRQYLIMNAPMRLLCRPDCAGLCASCGANRNSEPCSCQPASGEDRWAALRQMLERGAFPTRR